MRERLWRGPFRHARRGRPGDRRVRAPPDHQQPAPEPAHRLRLGRAVGTPVLATNAGRVALVAEHFFAGRNVVLDHGLGLFTLYYHLVETRVAAGE